MNIIYGWIISLAQVRFCMFAAAAIPEKKSIQFGSANPQIPPTLDIPTIAGLFIVLLLFLILIILNQKKKSIISNKSKALAETEARYHLLFEHSPIPLLEEDHSEVKTFLDQLTRQGVKDLRRYFADNPESLARCAGMVRIQAANQAALSLYEATTPNALHTLTRILPDSQLFAFKNELVKIFTNGNSENVLENRTLNGATLIVERRVVVASGFEQNWNKVFASVIDITEQVRLRNENKAFEEQLQHTQKLEAIGSLAGGIAHDFNNLLAPIMGRAELMLLENPDNAPVQQHCQNIIEASKRARNLVKQILVFSRQVDQEIKPVSLVEIIQEIINLTQPTLPANISITCDVPETCLQIMADATQLHQVIMNLVTNAFHAMEEKGGCLSIHLETVSLGIDSSSEPPVSPGLYQQLRVVDTGHGMDQLTVSKIFNPYFTTKPRDKGTGLGLTVVLGILRGYGGEILVTSAVGEGTTFTLYFPAVELAAVQDPIIYGDPNMLPVGNEHILVVDDEKSIADVTTGMLEKLGYTVTARISGYDALEAFRNLADRIDLVMADLTMPQMTGLQLYREIKRIQPHVKVILCTGFSEQLDSRSAKSIGIDGFLHKPVVMSDLAHCIRSVLDG